MDERRRSVETAQEKDGCCDEAKQDGEIVRYQILVHAEPGCHGRRAGQRARQRTRQNSVCEWESPVSKLIQIQKLSFPSLDHGAASSLMIMLDNGGGLSLASSLPRWVAVSRESVRACQLTTTSVLQTRPGFLSPSSSKPVSIGSQLLGKTAAMVPRTFQVHFTVLALLYTSISDRRPCAHHVTSAGV